MHKLLIIIPILLCGFREISGERPALVGSTRPLPVLLDSLGLKPEQTWVHVSKPACTLSVKHNTLVIKSYPVVFGTDPVHDKRCKGDGCTPEGEFQLTAKYPHKRYGHFIYVNYPTPVSQEKFRQALRAGTIPADAEIGGEIGIHGVPEGYDYEIDRINHWTVGCVAMKRGDVADLYTGIWTGMYCKIEG